MSEGDVRDIPGGKMPMDTVDDEGRIAGEIWSKTLLARTTKGQITQSAANVAVICRHDSALRGAVALNLRSEDIVLRRPLPNQDASVHESNGDYPRAWTDDDTVALQAYVGLAYGVTIPLNAIDAGVHSEAKRNAFDAVRDYLDGLKWDEVKRLEGMLVTYFGVQDSKYARAVGLRWMISAIARTYQPGCKVDHVLILVGEQGKRKSTALEILAGAANFGDDVPPLAHKDAQAYLSDKWIVELAEWDSPTKAGTAKLKSFLTTKVDRFRPAYGRSFVNRARRCVFAGTVNHTEFLQDPTGERRFWPVETQWLELDALRQDRDQLWAEAKHLYKSGRPWWLETEELESLARDEQTERSEVDLWEAPILKYIKNRRKAVKFVSTADILEGIGVEVGRMTKRDARRVASVMRSVDGWERCREGGSGARGYRREVHPFDE